jgi:hypothetical protein
MTAEADLPAGRGDRGVLGKATYLSPCSSAALQDHNAKIGQSAFRSHVSERTAA